MTALLYLLGFLSGAAAAYLIGLIIKSGRTDSDGSVSLSEASRQIMKY